MIQSLFSLTLLALLVAGAPQVRLVCADTDRREQARLALVE